MSHWRQHPLPWLIATVALASLPQLMTMPAPLVLLTLSPMLWRGLAALRHWRPLPSLVRIALTFAGLAMLVLSYGNLLGRRAAVGLLTVMLAMKLLECFRARDARIVASLTLFLCSTQFLFSQGLPMVFYGIGVSCGALLSLALIERHDSWGRSGQTPPSGLGLRRELGFGSRLLLLAVPMALAVFLLFPRWGTPLWGLPEQSLDARSGLSTSMTPGSIQGLFMDDSPAFRARFEGSLPSREELYWRGPVMWNFDGRSWSFGGWMRGLERQTLPNADAAPYRYEVQMEPNERHWLFALDYPGLIPDKTRLTEDFQLLRQRRHAITSLFRYDMVSDPGFQDSPELSIVLRNAALQLPEQFNPRTRELVERWRAETPNDAALVRRVLAHFNQQPFRYTLNPPLLSRHSVDEFLFDTQAGFCEHYASTFTVMMRMAGIPARVVTGYQGGWYNELGNYLLVRQSDAHAWAEIWLPGVGWTRIDPTAAVAPSRVEDGPLDALNQRRHAFDFPWMRQIRNGFDILDRTWNQWVIGFDAARQSNLLGIIGIEKLQSRDLALLLAVVLLLGSVAVVPWLKRLGKRRERDALLRQWRRFIGRLADAGVPVSAALGPLEVGAAAASHLPTQAQAARQLAQEYLAQRYGDEAGDREALIQGLKKFRARTEKHGS